jgi:hypothetical protein
MYFNKLVLHPFHNPAFFDSLQPSWAAAGTIDRNEEFIKMTLAVLMAPE